MSQVYGCELAMVPVLRSRNRGLMGKPENDEITDWVSYHQEWVASRQGMHAGLAEIRTVIVDGWAIQRIVSIGVVVSRVE